MTMPTTPKKMRTRAMTVLGGVAIIGTTGAGLASGATAATNSSSAATVLAKIKYCESGGNYQAVNSSTGASGAYQFLNSTWKGLSAARGYATAASAPASVQDAAALELFNESGTSPWAASSGCWSHLASTPTSTASTTTASTTTTGSTAAAATSSTTTSSSTTKQHPTMLRKAAKQAPPKAHAAKPKPSVQPVRLLRGHGRHHAAAAVLRHPAPKPMNRLAPAA